MAGSALVLVFRNYLHKGYRFRTDSCIFYSTFQKLTFICYNW